MSESCATGTYMKSETPSISNNEETFPLPRSLSSETVTSTLETSTLVCGRKKHNLPEEAVGDRFLQDSARSVAALMISGGNFSCGLKAKKARRSASERST